MPDAVSQARRDAEQADAEVEHALAQQAYQRTVMLDRTAEANRAAAAANPPAPRGDDAIPFEAAGTASPAAPPVDAGLPSSADDIVYLPPDALQGPASETQRPVAASPPPAVPPVAAAAHDEAALPSITYAPADAGSGQDVDPQARARRYLEEYERKLFPEIALGKVRLDDSRGIVGLARTFYQEDFDPVKAISFLEYALSRSSDPMRIHLALLEVLRLERRARDYARVARAFQGQYPDSGTHWQLVAAYGRMLDPAEPLFAGERVPGLDLDTPSNWLGNTMDMTKYVLGQKVADSVRGLPAPAPAPGSGA
ncbi:MAG: hypothetical protein JNM90_04245 [Burkholderiales bacterium]|nr:hypothetical protein [Burkholderiales bacterium]